MGKDHRDEPERIDGLVEPVIGVEAGLECERGSGQQRDQGGGERGKRTDTHGRQRLRLAAAPAASRASRSRRSEEHTSELQSLMRISYAVFCLKKKKET